MSYQNAIQTKMMDTYCVCCGKPIVDSRSIEIGMGPDCREQYDGNIPEETREGANKLVFAAAQAAQGGRVSDVLNIADAIESVGLPKVAEKIRERFAAIAENPETAVNVKIRIKEEGDRLVVETPFKRSMKDEFIQAMRNIPGRQYDRKRGFNTIPATSKAALWVFLNEFFPGVWGVGPKGAFRVPPKSKTKKK